MSKDVKLKPCPFCGGNNSEINKSVVRQTKYVACWQCEARGPECTTHLSAAIAWNTRTVRRVRAGKGKKP